MADDGWISEEDTYVPPPVSTSNYDRRNTRRDVKEVRNMVVSNSNWRKNDRDSSNTDSMLIASNLVGKIIGRGGSKIRELESESQAKIHIVKDQGGSNQTTIELSGSQSAKEKARNLIETLLEDRPQRGYGRFHSNEDSSYNRNTERSVTTCNQQSNYNQPTSTDYSNGATQEDEQVYDWQAILEKNKRAKEEHWATLPPIYKDFYVEDPEIAGMSDRDVARWREDNNKITVERIQHDQDNSECKRLPNPVHTFQQAFANYPEILQEIQKQQFTAPSPIQSQAWPVLLSGEDLIGIAQTGTGKTLAFLLPALIHIDNQPIPVHQRDGPNVLILAPTRELAVQIDKEVKKYQYKGYKSVCIYGGASRSDQIEIVSKGVQIVIATPGRLNDLVKAKHINVEAVTYLVLDEADRMLDMGFGPQIRVSLLEIRPNRQTVMTSATWPSGVQRLAELYMKNPIRVIVGSLDLAAVHSVEQTLLFVNDDIQEKFEILLDFIATLREDDKVIIFCSKRATTITIAADLAMKGVNFQSIYGGLDQSDREQALEDMRDGSASILVATDVASRGIDIENITHIVNFDFPTSLEEFVHRVGRTGRAGRTGKAITYMSRRDWDKAEGLIAILEEAGQVVPEELVSMAERFKKKAASNDSGRGRGGRRGGYNRYNY